MSQSRKTSFKMSSNPLSRKASVCLPSLLKTRHPKFLDPTPPTKVEVDEKMMLLPHTNVSTPTHPPQRDAATHLELLDSLSSRSDLACCTLLQRIKVFLSVFIVNFAKENLFQQ